jgi:hypothetical protein
MDVYVTDDQIGRYFRRIQLGLRLLAHGARAQTTCQWSGLTPDQLVTLRRRWMFTADERLRGPSPSSFQVFFRSAKISSQAALFVCICRIVGAAKPFASIESGEKLCEAFEIYREWEPRAAFEFEQAILLVTGLAHAEKIMLKYCSNCASALLVDKLAGARRACNQCRRRQSRSASSTRQQHHEHVVQGQDESKAHR